MEAFTVAAIKVNVVEVAPCGIVTEPGMMTAEPDRERVTTTPPAGAAPVSCTVPVPDWPLARFGEAEILLRATGTGLTVTAVFTETLE